MSATETDEPKIDLRIEQNRIDTFKDWPIPYLTPQTLAKCGFYYFGLEDQVRCAWCAGIIAKWEIGDNPFTEHLRFFPECPRAQLGPHIDFQQADESVEPLGIQQIRPPKIERFSTLDARLRSFANWPRGAIQSPETLAMAGFFYQNQDDHVLCFQCNGGLRSWQREDDAWFEHARCFPKCEFVHLVKGPHYIAHVQEIAKQQERDRPTLDDAMASEPTQIALQMGLSEGRIRAVTKYQLERFGCPFKSAETLIDAVLDYQREEELRQNAEDGDDDDEQSSSSIVQEVSRILNTIFNINRTPGRMSVSFDNESTPTPDYQRSQTPEVIDADSIPSTSQDVKYMETSSLNANIVPEDEVEVESESESSTPSTTETTETSTNAISLEEENRQLKEARLCKVCMDGDVGVVFLPCSHLVTCVQCAPSVNACPLCRAEIKAIVRTFLS